MKDREPLRAGTEIIPNYNGRLLHFQADQEKRLQIHLENTVWGFSVEGLKREIPVFSIWNYKNHNEIAQRLAQGQVCVMNMWGTYGVGLLVKSPEWPRKPDKADPVELLRNELKKGRPSDMPFIPFMYPEDHIDFWDVDRL